MEPLGGHKILCVGVESLMSTPAAVKILGHISPVKITIVKTTSYSKASRDIPS
jgi:hypothetical protein